MFQVLAGSALGWLASKTIPEPSQAKAKEYYGWHPNNPAKSASAIAATTASATGVPQAASALMPSPTDPPEGEAPIPWVTQKNTSLCTFSLSPKVLG